MGAFYLAVNRNKRSIVLDLKQEAARGGAAAARRGRQRAAPQLPAAGGAAARHVLRDVPRGQPGPRLRRHLRLPGRRALRRQAGLRRHHPGRLRPGLAAGLDRRRAALRADDRRGQEQLDDGAGRGARRPLPPGAHRRGPGGRGADVREHGGLGHGGAPLRGDVRAAARHDRLQADPQPEPPPVPDEGRLPGDPAVHGSELARLLHPHRTAGPARRPALQDAGDPPAPHRDPVRRAAEDRAHPHERGVAGRARPPQYSRR